MKVKNNEPRLIIAGDVPRRDPARRGSVVLGTHLMPGEVVDSENLPGFATVKDAEAKATQKAQFEKWVRRQIDKGRKLQILEDKPAPEPQSDEPVRPFSAFSARNRQASESE